MNRRTILRVILLLAFGALTAFSIALELLAWDFQTHSRAYLGFFGLALLTLGLVYLSFPKTSDGVSGSEMSGE